MDDISYIKECVQATRELFGIYPTIEPIDPTAPAISVVFSHVENIDDPNDKNYYNRLGAEVIHKFTERGIPVSAMAMQVIIIDKDGEEIIYNNFGELK